MIIKTCDHCGRVCGDLAGGHGTVSGLKYSPEGLKRTFHLCHPNEPNRPDCYHLVTTGREQLGSRIREERVRRRIDRLENSMFDPRDLDEE